MRKRLESRVPVDPDAVLLTVEEAASLLRIGRSTAYMLANVYLATNGSEGLPVIRLGRCLRVPAARLRQLVAAELPTMAAPALTSIPTASLSRRATSDTAPSAAEGTRKEGHVTGPSTLPDDRTTSTTPQPSGSDERIDTTPATVDTSKQSGQRLSRERAEERSGPSSRTPRNSTHQCITDAATPLPGFDTDAHGGAGDSR